MAGKGTLATRVKKLIKEELEEDMELITGILRTEKDYGRAVLKKIGTSPLLLYDEMSRRGHIKEDDYSFLIDVLKTADLDEAVGRLVKLIKDHSPASRSQDLSTNVLKRQGSHSAGYQSGIDTKRQRFSQTSGGSQRSVDSLMSPDGYTPQLVERPSEKCYNVERGKGLVAIINNFTDCSGSTLIRRGTNADERRIRQFFEEGPASNHYEMVETRHDLNYEEFKLALTEWAQMLKSRADDFHSFFLFILSHGDEEGVMAFHMDHKNPPSDLIISVGEINKEFQGCLRGKPKVVVIQACQGEEDAVEPDGVPTKAQQPEELGGDEDVEEVESDNKRKINAPPPETADMLTAFATVKGYRAYRMNEARGSWFIQKFMNQLESSCDSNPDHLLDILTSTHYDVSAQKGKTPTADSTNVNKRVRVQQMPCFQSTLRKKFYLLPQFM